MLKILIVASGNSSYGISPFIKDQADSLKRFNADIDYFLIEGHGVLGYLKNFSKLKRQINTNTYDIIHAHFGLSGLLSVLQRKVPVIITFHGGDIYRLQSGLFVLSLSWLASLLSFYNIYVNNKIPILFKIKKYQVIPCGVDLDIFYPMDKKNAKEKIVLNKHKQYVLFSSSFNNKIKNFGLAKKAVELINGKYVKLIELKGYNRKEVNLLLNGVDCLLVTSVSETGPVVVKEAMACNIPIVSTDVGDVREVIGKTEGCYITSFKPEDVADKIKKALAFGKRTTGREDIKHLEAGVIAKKIIEVYNKVLEK